MDLVPKTLNDFIYNRNIADILSKYSSNYLENLIFYGQNNSGKRTLISSLLLHLSDENKTMRTMKTYPIKINNNNLSINFIESKYHFEINLYEYGHYDRAIISHFFKYILSYKNISKLNYKIIVLHHFDKVSKVAQLALRRIIEKSHKIGRFIVCCENIGKIDKALLSRFVCIRVPKPKKKIIEKYISHQLKKYNKNYNKKTIKNIIDISDKCIYKINLLLDNYIHTNIIDGKLIIKKKDIIRSLCVEIEKKDIASIEIIRKIVYKYLLLNISPKLLFMYLSDYYNTTVSNISKKHQLITLNGEIGLIIDKIKYDIFALEYYIIRLKYILLE